MDAESRVLGTQPKLLPASPPAEPLISARDLLRTVFGYKWLILAIFLGGVCTTLMALWIRVPRYEVHARVLIKYGREAGENPRTSIAPGVTRLTSPTRPDINSEAEFLKSYSIAERVVRDFGLDKSKPAPVPTELFPRAKYEMRRVCGAIREQVDEVQYRLALKERLSPKDRAIVEILSNMKVEAIKDSSVVDIKIRTSNKEGSGAVLNRMVEIYRDMRLGIEKNPQVEQFFRSRAGEYGDKLQESERALNALKRKEGVGALGDQIALTTRNIAQADAALKETAARLVEMRAQATVLERQIGQEKPTALIEQVEARNTLLDTLYDKRAALMLERERLLTKFTDDHVSIRDMDQQITNLTKLIAEADVNVQQSRKTGENTLFMDLRKQYAAAVRTRDSLESRYKEQSAAVGEYRARMRRLQDLEVAYNQLSREVQLNDESYKLYEKNAAEANAAEALNTHGITSIALMDPAVDPILPVGMRRSYIFGGALVASLLLGLGAAFLLDTSRNTITSRHKLMRCVPVLASYEFQKSINGAQVLQEPGNGMLQESLLLAAQVRVLSAATGSRAVAVIGANEKAGATTVSAMLAQALSLEGRDRTLLVSIQSQPKPPKRWTPLWSTNGHRLPGFDLTKADVSGHIEAVTPQLSCIRVAYFPETLTVEETARQLAALQQRFAEYGRIVLDLSSSVPREKRLAVSLGCSGVVLVVEADRTRDEDLAWMNAEFHRWQVPVFGAVLNKHRNLIPRLLYKWV